MIDPDEVTQDEGDEGTDNEESPDLRPDDFDKEDEEDGSS